MASRLIQRETETQRAPAASGYVSPVAPALVVAPAPVAETLPVETHKAEIPTMLLSRHIIEPELLGVLPRLVEPTTPIWTRFIGLFGIIPSSFSSLNLYLKNPDTPWLLVLPALLLSLGVTVVIVLHKFLTHQYRPLRDGAPRRAFVEMIGKASFVNGSRTMTYRYENAPGEFVSGTVQIPATEFATRPIAPGYVFTLLVPRDGVGEPLPYFMATTHRVVPVPATVVSRNVSMRVAGADAARLALTAKQTGTLGAIEPELLTATPRQVRTTQRQLRLWQRDFATGTVLIAALLWYAIYARSMPISSGFFLIPRTIYFALPLCLSKNRGHQNGVVARATVSARHTDPRYRHARRRQK